MTVDFATPAEVLLCPENADDSGCLWGSCHRERWSSVMDFNLDGYRPRFDPDAFLAYWIDLDQGYRGAAQRRWRIVPLRDLLPAGQRLWERQRLELESAVGATGTMPSITLEPISGGRVRVNSEVSLALRAYDEALPRRVSGVAEIGYGSVVRAGPLLFTLLYDEQVESLEAGRITLPFIGGALEQPTAEEDDDLSGSLAERKRALRLWQGAFGASFLFTAVATVAVVLGLGLSFRYEGSVLDKVAACVACIVIAWSALVAVGLPIQRAMLGWTYSPPSPPDR